MPKVKQTSNIVCGRHVHKQRVAGRDEGLQVALKANARYALGPNRRGRHDESVVAGVVRARRGFSCTQKLNDRSYMFNVAVRSSTLAGAPALILSSAAVHRICA